MSPERPPTSEGRKAPAAPAGGGRPKRSVIRRLIFGLTRALGVSFLLALAAFALYGRWRGEAETRAAAAEAAGRLAAILSQPLWDLDLPRASLVVDAFSEDPRVRRIEVHVLSGNETISVLTGDVTDAIWAESVVMHEGSNLGTVRVALSRELYQQELVRQYWTAFGFSLIGILVVFFSTSLLVRHYLDPPLNELSAIVADYGDPANPPQPVDFPHLEFQPFYRVLQEMGRQLEQQLKEILNSEERLRALMEYSTDIVTIVDDQGLIRYEAPVVQRILGYQPSQLLGESVFNLVHPDDRGRVMAVFREGVETPGLTAMVEYRARHADGRYIDLESIGSNRMDVPGIEGIVVFTRDISERKRVEQDQQRLRDQLSQAQKMESIGRLAGGVAHDFNNILQAITVYAEMLKEALPAGTEPREHASEIGRSAERASALTRQLLAFARKQAIEPRPLDLNEVVSSIIQMLKRLIGEDIDLVWIPAKGRLVVNGDAGQLDQVLANLVVNARDAVGGVGRITIETGFASFDAQFCEQNPGYLPGDYVSLAVSDTGSGMDQETIGSIFEPFFTTKGKSEGTGLGLATVYGIVKQNGGFINVASELGKGSSFRLYFPRAAGAAEAAAGKAVPAARSARATETILLVEDDPQLLALTNRILTREGYAVLPAGNPVAALDLAREHEGKLHLLLSDVIMPEMSGRDLLAEITSLVPGIKCLFMSGYTADVIAHRGVLDAGVNFIEKPFSVLALTAKVRDVLGA